MSCNLLCEIGIPIEYLTNINCPCQKINTVPCHKHSQTSLQKRKLYKKGLYMNGFSFLLDKSMVSIVYCIIISNSKLSYVKQHHKN
jgi:hypothetical protein